MSKSLLSIIAGFALLTVPALSAFAHDSYKLHENAELTIALSSDNYNRLAVKGDKIITAHFPPGALALENEQDGSLYAIVNSDKPFTLFLTTENHRHFSLTVNKAEGLGKTIEFIPDAVLTPKANVAGATSPGAADNEASQDSKALGVLNTLVRAQEPQGFSLTSNYHAASSVSGLKFFFEKLYTGKQLKAEVIKIYNYGKKSVNIDPELFYEAGTIKVAASQDLVLPHKSIYLYRISRSDNA
jgi:conjugal transfer pilus assembly protein TraK